MAAIVEEILYHVKRDGTEITPDIAEVLRYAGQRNTGPQDAVREEAARCIKEMEQQIRPRAVWACYPLRQEKKEVLSFAGTTVQSKALSKNLTGCDRVVLFAATLGAAPDQMIARAQVADMSRALLLQAAGAAFIEEFCDRLCEEIREQAKQDGRFLRPRFSPGYGDLSLDLQKTIVDRLCAFRSIGLTLTDSLLLMPSKSVTALIGLSGEDAHCLLQGCEACEKRDCAFRREEER